jgi:hypothetical protein
MGAVNFLGGSGPLSVRLLGPSLSQLADTTNNVLVVFFVLRFAGASTVSFRSFSDGALAGDWGWFPRYSNGQAYWDGGPQATARVNGLVTGTTISTSATIARLVRNGSLVSMHYNNTQIASRSNASGAFPNTSLATAISGGDNGSSALVSEIIAYSRAISSEEIAAIQSALAQKYGVTLA